MLSDHQLKSAQSAWYARRVFGDFACSA